MPLMVLTASSILSVISVSICSGAAPGCTVVMTTVGKSTLGNRSTPSFVNENAPTTVSERMRTVAKTGRRTQSAASHCITGIQGAQISMIGFVEIASSTSQLATFWPSTSWATLVVATFSPAFSPLVISTSCVDGLSDRDDAALRRDRR